MLKSEIELNKLEEKYPYIETTVLEIIRNKYKSISKILDSKWIIILPYNDDYDFKVKYTDSEEEAKNITITSYNEGDVIHKVYYKQKPIDFAIEVKVYFDI